MIAAGITIVLLVVLVIAIRLVAKSLYRESKTTRAVHTNERVRAKTAPHVVSTTSS
ncbi:MAG: hypothetical protein WC455_07830 [Dehalococcoidia bacterium]|jgi:hypothetical protein